MAKLDRPDANVVPFASQATSGKRWLFGEQGKDVPQSGDDLTSNLTDAFFKGFEDGVTQEGKFATLQNMNALGYVLSGLVTHLYQGGIAQWNAKQEYFESGLALGLDGQIYQALTNNTGKDPADAGDGLQNLGSLDDWTTFGDGAVGSVQRFYCDKDPRGFVFLNGALLPRQGRFARLWKFVQSSGNLLTTDTEENAGHFTVGDGSTTFRIPDLRGMFDRCVDERAGANAGPLGDEQGYAMIELTGSVGGTSFYDGNDLGNPSGIFKNAGGIARGPGGGGPFYINSSVIDLAGGDVPVAEEIRPVNVASRWCIKY